jgi:hypothetical protein
MTADYGYVSVHHTTDPAQGEVLAELLRNEGIAARFRGAASTLIGIAEELVSMSVEVPAEDEARARDFLRALGDTALAASSGARALPPLAPAAAPDPRAQRPRGRGRALAAAVVATLVLVGLAIAFYALR